MRPRTRLCHFEGAPDDPWHPMSTPIYQTATFEVRDDAQAYAYSRSGNPTRAVLERLVADLEGGAGALASASGLASLALTLRLARPGQRVVGVGDLYGGTHRLLTAVAPRVGLRPSFAREGEMEDELARGEVALVFVESPTNPLLEVVDLRRLADRCRARGARLVVDSSAMSPALQNPLSLGADVVVHSATKLLAGHADVTGGVVVAGSREVLEELAFFHNAEGAALGAFESWLTLRGMKTLGARLDRQQASAMEVAEVLERTRTRVARVRFPGLASHEGHTLHASQAAGPGCVLTFEVEDGERARRVIGRLGLFRKAFSFGSVHSTVSTPASMSHQPLGETERGSRGIRPGLVRLSVGLEDVRDLIEDLEQALD